MALFTGIQTRDGLHDGNSVASRCAGSERQRGAARQIRGKVSQTNQLDSAGAERLRELLRAEFGL